MRGTQYLEFTEVGDSFPVVDDPGERLVQLRSVLLLQRSSQLQELRNI